MPYHFAPPYFAPNLGHAHALPNPLFVAQWSEVTFTGPAPVDGNTMVVVAQASGNAETFEWDTPDGVTPGNIAANIPGVWSVAAGIAALVAAINTAMHTAADQITAKVTGATTMKVLGGTTSITGAYATMVNFLGYGSRYVWPCWVERQKLISLNGLRGAYYGPAVYPRRFPEFPEV